MYLQPKIQNANLNKLLKFIALNKYKYRSYISLTSSYYKSKNSSQTLPGLRNPYQYQQQQQQNPKKQQQPKQHQQRTMKKIRRN